jgi:hypothetical protein
MSLYKSIIIFMQLILLGGWLSPLHSCLLINHYFYTIDLMGRLAVAPPTPLFQSLFLYD